MADFNIPALGAEIKPMPSMSLADMVNMARGVQAYQQAQQINPLELQQKQQATRTGEINLGVAEQANLERLNMQRFFSNPSNFQTDGRIDLNKINNEVTRLAPLTGADYISKFSTLANAQTTADSAIQQLNQSDRALIASPLATLGYAGIKDPNAYKKVIQQTIEQNKNNPRLAAVGQAYLTQLDFIPPDVLPDAGIKASQNLMTPKEVSETFAPRTEITSEGLTKTVQRKPGAAPTEAVVGKPGGIPQLNYEATGRVDPFNRPTAIVKDPSGKILGEVVIPAGINAKEEPFRIPAGQTPESGKQFLDEINQARGQAQPANIALNNVRTIRQYLPLASTGKYSEAISGLQSVLGNVAGSKPEEIAAAARDIIEKNMADLAIQKNAALGGKFAADLSAVQSSLASAGKNPTAIAKVMDQLEPLLQHVYNYQHGLDLAVQKSPEKQFSKPEFDRKMNDAFDIKAMQMYNAWKNNGDAGLKKFNKENNIDLKEQRRLFDKLKQYDKLTEGEM